MGAIEQMARERHERYREHYQDETWHVADTDVPEWDDLPYVERIVLLKTEADLYDRYKYHPVKGE